MMLAKLAAVFMAISMEMSETTIPNAGMLFLDTQAAIIRQGECLSPANLTQQPAEIGLVKPVQPLLMGIVQGDLVVFGGYCAAQFGKCLRPATGMVLGHDVEVGIGGQVLGNKSQNSLGFLKQPRHEHMADHQAGAGAAFRIHHQSADLALHLDKGLTHPLRVVGGTGTVAVSTKPNTKGQRVYPGRSWTPDRGSGLGFQQGASAWE